MNQPTVKSLRQQGYKVKVLHYRKYEYKHSPEKFDKVKYLSCKGGMTEVLVTAPSGKTEARGTAICADEDNYNKKLGVKIALGRAFKTLNKPSKTKSEESVGKLEAAIDEYHKLH